jgi:OOP family OmpA-OmpF porin
VHGTDLGEAGLAPSGSSSYRTFGGSALFYAGKNRHRYKRHGLTGYGRLGYGFLSNSRNGTEVNFVQDNATHLIFGLGLEYTGRRGLGIRAEGIYFDADVRYGQLSLLYRFGRNPDRRPMLIVDQRRTSMPVYREVSVPVAAAALPEVTPQILDGDSDGVDDQRDFCPGTAVGIAVDAIGCEVFNGALDGLNFPSNSAELTAEARRRLDAVVQTLKAYPDMKFVVAAHTDDRGAADANHVLSKRRVVSVGRYLADAGIDQSRFTLRAYGETRPIASNDTAEGRLANRRVELIIAE